MDAALGTRHHIAAEVEVPSGWLVGDAIRSGAVLDALLAEREAADSAEDRAITLVVTAPPLVVPDGRAVYGEAAIGGGCAVIGVGSLDGGSGCSETTLADRAGKAALHECAHAAGLEHCADPACVMYPARDIAGVDRKAKGFCARCTADLAHATLDAAPS